jgi:glycosyltransferase involved in cell wall biosynthesis
MQRRVIHVYTTSIHGIHPAGTTLDYSRYTGLWHFRLARRLRMASDTYAQECWAIDSTLREEVKWEREGITVRVFPCARVRHVGEYSRDLLRALRAESLKKGTIILFHGLFSYSTLLSPLLITGAPMVVQHHGLYSLLQRSKHAPRTAIKLGAFILYVLSGFWLLERAAIPRFDRIFVLNREEEEYVSRLAGKERVELLTMGIDFDDFVPMNKGAAQEKIGLTPGNQYIVYVGTLVVRKGVGDLLNALPAILKEFPNAILLVVGVGYLRKQLVTLAQELGVTANVAFEPSDDDSPIVPDHMLPAYYSAADAVVMPSWNEGLGIVAVEALACGAPLVATNVGGLPEVLATYKAGVLVPPRSPEAVAAAVIDVLGGKHSFVIDRENARRVYDWRVIAAKHLEVYDTLFREYYGE